VEHPPLIQAENMKVQDITTLDIHRIIESVVWTGFRECGPCGEVEACQYSHPVGLRFTGNLCSPFYFFNLMVHILQKLRNNFDRYFYHLL